MTKDDIDNLAQAAALEAITVIRSAHVPMTEHEARLIATQLGLVFLKGFESGMTTTDNMYRGLYKPKGGENQDAESERLIS